MPLEKQRNTRTGCETNQNLWKTYRDFRRVRLARYTEHGVSDCRIPTCFRVVLRVFFSFSVVRVCGVHASVAQRAVLEVTGTETEPQGPEPPIIAVSTAPGRSTLQCPVAIGPRNAQQNVGGKRQASNERREKSRNHRRVILGTPHG